jgi:predicted SAM-dependent methyltransferase
MANSATDLGSMDGKYPSTALKNKTKINEGIDAFLANLRKNITKGLHLGCGGNTIPELINCDLYNPDADMKADAACLSEFEDSSVDVIESHHMIEHLSFEDTDKALQEWHRVLKPKGFLVITYPDMKKIFQKWLAYSFIYPVKPYPDRMDYVVQMLVGSQENDGMFHRNAFDVRRMTRILSSHGFTTEFSYAPYPLRPTPSRITIARKNAV